MLAVTLLVASVALADSINPSTLVPGMWLARDCAPGRLTSYTLGVFAAYLIGGLVLLLGPGPALITALHHVRGTVEHAVLLTGGVVVLGVAFGLWRSRRRPVLTRRPRRRAHTRASAFALGAGIMTIELPTAFMYFGAISAIVAAHLATSIGIVLLIAYNALFVAPLVALLALRRLAGIRGDRWIEASQARLRYAGALALAGVAGTAGTALCAIGLSGLLVG